MNRHADLPEAPLPGATDVLDRKYAHAALDPTHVDAFRQEGFLVLRGFRDAAWCAATRAIVDHDLASEVGPVEFEAEVGYAGAPSSLNSEGGHTIRRLRDAFQRNAVFQDLAQDPILVRLLTQLLQEPPLLVLGHHNCVMTKHPCYGTATGWHRDIRYWSFAHNALISAWLPLDRQRPDNGGLRVIPASHLLQIERAQMDELDFLRTDVDANIPIVTQGVDLYLNAGDLLLFHSGLFHAAGKNQTPTVKEAIVFAYTGVSNPPLPGTRSAAAPVIDLMTI